MTRQTDLHNYTVPTTGDGDYENTFSTYFDNIDRDVPIRDVESNLSNYTPKSGAKFLATDTENEFIGDGSTWNQLQTAGPNPSYNSASADELTSTRHLTPSRPTSAVVFKDGSTFYADGDTKISSSSDIATVINDALTYLGVDSSVVVKPSVYKDGTPQMTAKLFVGERQTLKGETPMRDTNSNYALQKASGATMSELIEVGEAGVVENLNIYGRAGDGSGTLGINSTGKRTTINECTVTNFDGSNASLQNNENRIIGGRYAYSNDDAIVIGGSAADSYVMGGTMVHDSYRGIYVGGNNSHVLGANVFLNNKSGVYQDADNIDITAVRSNTNGLDGFEIRGETTVANCRAHSNSRRGYQVNAPAVISGGRSRLNDEEGVFIGGTQDVTVSGGFHALNNGQDTGLADPDRVGIWSNSDDVVIGEVRIYDDQATKTQQHGIYLDSGVDPSIGAGNIKGNAQANLVDNATGTAISSALQQ